MSWMLNTHLLRIERQDNMANRSRHQPSTTDGTSSSFRIWDNVFHLIPILSDLEICFIVSPYNYDWVDRVGDLGLTVPLDDPSSIIF